jgi:hypothetical protein
MDVAESNITISQIVNISATSTSQIINISAGSNEDPGGIGINVNSIFFQALFIGTTPSFLYPP